jgi:hypothetical protein
VVPLALLDWLAPIAFAQPACGGPAFFRICYDSSLKAPVWTEYEFRPEHLAAGAAPRRASFRRDPSAAFPTASNADFRNSGFARGHLVPAGDFAWSAEAHQATFFTRQRHRANAKRELGPLARP